MHVVLTWYFWGFVGFLPAELLWMFRIDDSGSYQLLWRREMHAQLFRYRFLEPTCIQPFRMHSEVIGVQGVHVVPSVSLVKAS